MAISEAEQKDLDQVKKQANEKRELFFSIARDIDRASDHQMETMGFKGKTHDFAIAYYFRSYNRQIDELFASFIKRWPD